MNNDKREYIKLQSEEISQESIKNIKAILDGINLYLSSFDNKSLFSFSPVEPEKYETAFMLFLSGISENISKLTDLNARLASLLIEADRAMMIETVLNLQKRFDAFCVFEKELYEYTESVDDAIQGKKISQSFIVAKTQKFKISTEYLLKENT